ncbi:MAG: hypothetical protein A2174_00420 [Candidatus Portnoybacteria bacterium RBG_13_41_18]|uniref:Fibronectin type-III domain-containing protein n=1 Tax=Candidatus Portnoybacteria bacterium RBG_13_41_18 TaxID=1801991 RepID=A0A1G2FAJ9_9BACT|nr:MAG: hypothetical protein A2174_00420 [Candidatus Portnoybacteria bacterium RBG_13_41_18]
MIKTKNILRLAVLSIFLLSGSFFPSLTEAALVGNTNNATFALWPDLNTYKTGSTFSVDIMVNTHGQNVVAVSAYINYSPSLFEVISIDDVSSSIFGSTSDPKEAEKSIDNTSGKLKITRGGPTPGVNTTNGKVATLTIKGKTDVIPASDNFNFDFTAGSTIESNVILNDGMGTDILSGVYNGRFTFDGTPPANISGFTATPGDKQITLGWINPTNPDFAAVKILRKTGSYPVDINDGVSIFDSNGTSYIDTGLTNGITYYYKAFSRDAVGNYSSGAQVSAAPINTVAPAQITNLAATAITARTVKLDWIAVGDDGLTGTAASYDIRYSTVVISAANFSSATQISGAPSPKPSGSAETVTIGGLLGNTTYYFAIKAVDGSGNASTISNVVNSLTYKTADINYDRSINSVDFGMLMSWWGDNTKPPADINQDGFINSVDFGIMMSQWG